MKPFTKKLVLENGREFFGYGYGADVERVCELVFNTSMVGYQEILSDPSYTGQIVVMTYPLIGNYGITDEDFETKFPSIGGMVVRECNENPSNFRYTKTFSEVLDEQGIPCIGGVDTRMITRIIRDEGCQRAAIVNIDTPHEKAMEMILSTPLQSDQVKQVSSRKRWFSRTPNHKYDIVAVDCGIKYNIIRQLNAKGCNVTVVPYNTTLDEIMAFNPDGIFLSNGPGDPSQCGETIAHIAAALKDDRPIMGICLGNQLLARAAGASTYKLKYGHRGHNQPVTVPDTDKCYITSQNHGFAIDDRTLPEDWQTLFVNVNDGTNEGIRHRSKPFFSTQYHPEASSGPVDTEYLFDRFIENIKIWKASKK